MMTQSLAAEKMETKVSVGAFYQEKNGDGMKDSFASWKRRLEVPLPD